MVMAFLAHQISQPNHFTTLVHTVVVQILKHLAPLQLRFISNIGQFLPQTLFNHPHKDAVGDLVLALLVAARKLFQVTAHGTGHLFHFGSR